MGNPIYEYSKAFYGRFGIDTEKAIEKALTCISQHQADDGGGDDPGDMGQPLGVELNTMEFSFLSFHICSNVI